MCAPLHCMNFHFRNVEVGCSIVGLLQQVSKDSTAIKILSKYHGKNIGRGKSHKSRLFIFPHWWTVMVLFSALYFPSLQSKYLKKHKYQFYINSLSLLPLLDTSKFLSYSFQPNLVLHLPCKPAFTATHTTSVSVLTKQSRFHARKTAEQLKHSWPTKLNTSPCLLRKVADPCSVLLYRNS